MPFLTQNFNLTGLQPGDQFSENGYAFFDDNLVRIDALLALGRDHEHTGASASIASPDTAPSLVYATDQGSLPAATTVRYRYTYVDQFGNETAASPEATVTTDSPIGSPDAVALSFQDTGGTLTGGLYRYALTSYVTANTAETRLGIRSDISVNFNTTTNQVTMQLPSLPTGATGFNVYRRAPGETVYNYLASIDMDVATPPTEYIDTGAVSPNCDRQPPNANNTNSQNNVDISLPGATPTVPANVTWKVYRSFQAGVWTASDLKHITEETFFGSGIIDPTYLDLGGGTGTETAPESSLIAAQPSKITFTDAQEIEGTAPVGFTIIPFEVTFSYGGPLAVTTGTSVWRCPFDKAQIQNVSATLGRGFLAASTSVIIDVNKFDTDDVTPSWTTIYTTQGNRPIVAVGEQVGTATVPDIVDVTENDMLSIDIDQTGGGATPTDEDLIVTLYMYVQSGSLTTTVTI